MVDRDEDFTAYVGARRDALVRAAVLLGCRLPEAEDVTQTALSRCYRSWEQVRRARDTDAYVHRVLINTFTRSRRRLWWGERPTEQLPADVSGTDEAELTAVAHTVRAALARLPVQQRAALVLRFFADLSEHQTAEALRVPPGTVKSRISRGLAALAADTDLTELIGDRSN